MSEMFVPLADTDNQGWFEVREVQILKKSMSSSS